MIFNRNDTISNKEDEMTESVSDEVPVEEPEVVVDKVEYAGLVRRGGKERYVLPVQQRLKSLKYKVKVDGVFGDETEEAVRKFQSKNGLRDNGIVDAATWVELFG